MTEPTQEHPNDDPFRPIRVTLSPAAEKLDAHLAESIAHFTPVPTVKLTEGKPQLTTPAPGSFAASLKAIVDEAKAGIEQAKADGLAQVRDAVGDLSKAKEATLRVTGNMADTVKSQAADIMAELGQISNDL
jgi:hypothetical protein